jgi:hypothetical protein
MSIKVSKLDTTLIAQELKETSLNICQTTNTPCSTIRANPHQSHAITVTITWPYCLSVTLQPVSIHEFLPETSSLQKSWSRCEPPKVLPTTIILSMLLRKQGPCDVGGMSARGHWTFDKWVHLDHGHWRPLRLCVAGVEDVGLEEIQWCLLPKSSNKFISIHLSKLHLINSCLRYKLTIFSNIIMAIGQSCITWNVVS